MIQLLRTLRLKITVISAVWFLFVGFALWRYYVLQVKRHDELLEKARKRYTYVAPRSGRRGEIFDAEGNLLVCNIPKVSISCSPYSAVHEPLNALENSRRKGVKESLPERREQRRRRLAVLLSKKFQLPLMQCYEKLTPFIPVHDDKGMPMFDASGETIMRKNQYLLLEREASPEFAASLKEELREAKLSAGFNFKNIYVRSYPKKRMLANVLGFTNMVDDTEIAQSGLEKHYAGAIKPDTVEIRYERSRDGSKLAYGIQDMKEAQDGCDLHLTIKESVQAILEDELDAAYEKWHPDIVYAVIVEPRTGNILALAQRPNFDPNDRSTFTEAGMGVRIATDSYEPGSVMKPFTIGKALDWGVVRPGDTVDCTKGVWFYGGKPMRDTHDYGMLTIGGVIQKSSNIGTAKIALMMGDEGLNRMLKTFHFGERVGLPFAQESPGMVPKLNSKRDMLAPTRVPIGYNVRVTPFQLVRAYCALANGGWMPSLRIVDKVSDPATGEMRRLKSKPPVQTFEHPEAVKQLVEMMISVTRKGGTATQADIPGYEVAGKTGTSRKYQPRTKDHPGGYTNRYYASFVGFVPARRPEMVMLVTFDSPRGASYGGVVAGPVFRKTMERVLHRMNIRPDYEPENVK